VTPGGVLAVIDGGGAPLVVASGSTATHGPGRPVDAGTIYDVASLTKPIATTGLLMKLVELGAVALDLPARDLVPELVAPGGEAVTLAHLAGHSAGFPDHVEFFRRLWAGERAGATTARDALVRMAGATPLSDRPGAVTRYSDVGYILLGAALERAAGERLDRAVARHVLAPLGMTSTFFVDLDAAARPALDAIAPTEICPVRGLVHGEVHDENAHAGGGIAGHAGLFATAGDVARFAAGIASAVAGRSGPFDPAVARHLATTPSTPGSTWRLGWEAPSPAAGVSHAGDRWPRDGFGHLGFTGCSMWIDAARARAVVLLTNRVHPSRDRGGIKELRRAVMDAVAGLLDGG
jgi:serine-type D-Ala-D-Ala carboxypeptidase